MTILLLFVLVLNFIISWSNAKCVGRYWFDQETILMFEQLASDLIYLFCVVTIVPTGFYIWFLSLKNFFERKTLANGLTAGYNTFAQLHNTVSAARNAPSAFERVVKTIFGGNSKKKDNTIVILFAIFIVIVAIFGGYFTASAIMKKADREYDMLTDLEGRYPNY